MVETKSKINVYLEIGKKRTFAGVIEWPGWCRSGHDEESALLALLDYGPRYGQALRGSRLGFGAPTDVSEFRVIERLAGDMTTDFGAPGIAPAADSRSVDDEELRRLSTILRACWRTFDAAVSEAGGKVLSKGPRGGGRELVGIVEHVLGGDQGYVSRLGGKLTLAEDEPAVNLKRARNVVLQTLPLAARGETSPLGPRGGKRWTPRYFVRRTAWHTLDHAWEIRDRIQS